MSSNFDTPLYYFELSSTNSSANNNPMNNSVSNDKCSDFVLDAKVNTNVCSYCHRNKKGELLIGAPYIGSMFGIVHNNANRMKFCDYICAKLYNDNRERITVDVQHYKSLYTKNKLDKKSRIIYERVGNNFFAFLPTYIVSDDDYITHRHTLERVV